LQFADEKTNVVLLVVFGVLENPNNNEKFDPISCTNFAFYGHDATRKS